MSLLPVYLALGLLTGFIAGLLGVGGGLVMVPVLLWVYALQGFPPEYTIHMALGTSLAVIVPTSISSMRAHHGHGAVRWDVVRRIAPGIVVGTLGGAISAAWLPDQGLKLFFVLFLFYAATQMWFGIKASPHRDLPDWPGMTLAGGVIGAISSWVGIGGGTLSVPFLNWCNIRFQEAIGTSAAIGLPIALSGTVGYALSGTGVAGLPSYSIGFVYLPALAGIALASMLTAPWGARLTHRLPVGRLRKLFAALLYLIAVRMTYGLATAG
jgi:uncharacterized membrane protein YfcA